MFLKDLINKWTSQINTSSVKLPKNAIESPKIQDNNQAISNGAINEKSNSSLRSGSKTRSVSRRSKKS